MQMNLPNTVKSVLTFVLFVYNAYGQGNFWEPASGPVPGTPRVVAIEDSGDMLMVTLQDFYRSSNHGDTWTKLETDFPEDRFLEMIFIDHRKIFWAGTNFGVYRSFNRGKNWEEISKGFLSTTSVEALAVNTNGDVFAGTDFGVYRSTNDGLSWTEQNQGLGGDFNNDNITDLAIDQNGVLFLASEGGMFRSSDNAEHWVQINNGLDEEFPQVDEILVHPNDDIIIGTGVRGVFRSSDSGESWHAMNNNLPVSSALRTVAISNNGDIFAGFLAIPSAGVYRYSEDSNLWTEVNTGLGQSPRILFLATASNGFLFTSLAQRGFFRSDDNGDNWIPLNNSLTDTQIRSIAIQDDGDVFVHAPDGGVFRSSDNGETWQQTNSGLPPSDVRNLVVHKNNDLFVASDGLFRSVDDGESWTKVEVVPEAGFTNLLASHEGMLFASTFDNVFRSFDNGVTWEKFSDGLNGFDILSLAFHCNGDILAPAIKPIGEFESEAALFNFRKYSNRWQKISSGPMNEAIFSLAIHPDGYFFATAGGRGIYRSSDHGENWEAVNSGLEQHTTVFNLKVLDSGDIYAGTLRNVYRSANAGNSWQEINSGMPPTNVFAFAVNDNGILFAATDDGLFRSVEPLSLNDELHRCTALTFRLEQNYPNPFNPKTSIWFHLAEPSRVKLRVFDLTGRAVTTLAAGEFSEGDHEITYQPQNLASGVYFYQLQVEAMSSASGRSFIETRRFTLLK